MISNLICYHFTHWQRTPLNSLEILVGNYSQGCHQSSPGFSRKEKTRPRLRSLSNAKTFLMFLCRHRFLSALWCSFGSITALFRQNIAYKGKFNKAHNSLNKKARFTSVARLYWSAPALCDEQVTNQLFWRQKAPLAVVCCVGI